MPVKTTTSARTTHRVAGAILVTLTLASLPMLVGCDDSDPTPPQSIDIIGVGITPSAADIGVGELVEFSAVALTAEGDTVEIPAGRVVWEWISSDPAVFTVEEDGTATGQSPGEAYCVIDAELVEEASRSTGADARLEAGSGFVGRDSAFVLVF